MTALLFDLPRPLWRAYALLALVFSLALLSLAWRRDGMEPMAWVAAYAVIGLVSLASAHGPLAAGFAAFLLGFVRTYRHGANLDLGLGLVTLAVAVHLLRRWRGPARTDLGGLLLLGLAGASVLSLAFAAARIRSFVPAPGFSYHVYRFNLQGLSSEDALLRVVLGAAGVFVWFGLYEYARSFELDRRALSLAILAALLLNAAALVKERLDPAFLHPAGMGLTDRLNGLTSYCWALGDVTLALFLLLPAWGSWKGWPGLVCAANLALLFHAAVASGSRSALLAMVAASPLWSASLLSHLSRRRARLAAVAAVVLSVALPMGAWAAYRATVPNEATPLGRLKLGIEKQGLFGHLYATRLSAYPLAFSVLRAYPLSGVGVGLFPAEVHRQQLLLAPQAAIGDAFLLSSNAPNQFLNAGVEMGWPALVSLLAVFVHAAASCLRSRADGGWLRLVGLGTLAVALMLGPGLQNSEAMVFAWLVVGQAAGPPSTDRDARACGVGRTTLLLLAAAGLCLAGQVTSRRALAVDSQWQRLRWPINVGMLAADAGGGRWTAPEATFVVDSEAPRLRIRWHAGDQAAPAYRAEVAFYVDGRLVERSPAVAGRIRESVLALPAVAGLKRISVRTHPPFVPAQALGGGDTRGLGVYLHAVSPEGAAGL